MSFVDGGLGTPGAIPFEAFIRPEECPLRVRMVAYEEEGVFAAPIDNVWRLLQAHLDDSRIHSIHPLILNQRTLSGSGPDTMVERTIDVRGKPMRSKWKVTPRPPESYRWEVVESEGPWAPGTFIENRYSTVSGGTRIQTRGELRISVLPFFIPQKSTIRKVLNKLDEEDLAAVPR